MKMPNEGDLAKTKEYAILIDGELIPVDERVYKAYYQPIWRQFKEAKRRGQCSCQDWRICKGDCAVCPYRTEGKAVSLDLLSEEYDHIPGAKQADLGSDVSASIINRFTIDELKRLIGELDPVYLEYCEALIKGIPEREIAKSMGVSQTTFNYRKLRLLDYLRSRLDSTEDRKQNHIAPPNTHRVKAGVSAMMSVEVLDELARADITEQSRDALVDISKITVRGDSPQQRLASYMEQVKNPYCFKVGNIPVKISFSDDGPTLEDTLTRFFKSIKKQRQV